MFTKYHCIHWYPLQYKVFIENYRVRVLKGQCADIKLFFSPDKVHGHILNHKFHNHKL